MPGQFQDKRTVGIPADITKIRNDTETFMRESEYWATEASTSATSARNSATSAAASASDAYEWMEESKAWAELRSAGVHFADYEPEYDKRYDGMLWLETDEDNLTIIAIHRWDATIEADGLFPEETLYPADDLYPANNGGWTTFRFYAPTTVTE